MSFYFALNLCTLKYIACVYSINRVQKKVETVKLASLIICCNVVVLKKNFRFLLSSCQTSKLARNVIRKERRNTPATIAYGNRWRTKLARYAKLFSSHAGPTRTCFCRFVMSATCSSIRIFMNMRLLI